MIYAFVVLYPVFWIVVNSLKPEVEYLKSTFSIPSRLHAENYAIAWAGPQREGLYTYLINTSLVTSPTLFGILILSALGGYGFARLRFRGDSVFLNYILIGLALPVHAMIIPLVLIYNNLGLLNTYWSLILTFIGFELPFGILLMRSFFVSFPREVEEAALIDGCSQNQLFWRIVLPLTKPAITALLVLSFLSVWNDFLFNYIFINDVRLWTLTRGIYGFIGEEQQVPWTVINAAFVISVLPTLAFYVFFQRELLSGTTAGALKA